MKIVQDPFSVFYVQAVKYLSTFWHMTLWATRCEICEGDWMVFFAINPQTC